VDSGFSPRHHSHLGAGDYSEAELPHFIYENANRLELHSIGWRFRFRFTYNSTDSNRVRRQLK
jgi:hypothetical protein